MTKVLICGDSFAADWTVKYKGVGWPNLLAKEFDVKNIAQAGCCEYKIYKQLLSQNLNEYDVILIAHTSAFRVFIENPHPVHKNDALHKDSDLIFTDLEEHSKTHKGLTSVLDFFKNFYSFEYAEFVHELIYEKINSLLKDRKVIHVTHTENSSNCPFEVHNFYHVFLDHRGLINHFDDQGNQIIFEKIRSQIYGLI